MKLNKKQEELLQELQVVDITKGLSSEDVHRRRNAAAITGAAAGSTNNTTIDDESNGFIYNVVSPPINCPSWVCCLLPCINHVTSMKLYKEIYPEDANVLRNGRWIIYDSTSLIVGDIIQISVGDLIPADCVILGFYNNNNNNTNESSSTYNKEEEEILVDTKYVTGYDKPISIILRNNTNNNYDDDNTKLHQLYWGSRIVQARTSIVAVVTAIGSQTQVGQLIQQSKFPPTIIPNDRHPDTTGTTEENEDGIALLLSSSHNHPTSNNHDKETMIV